MDTNINKLRKLINTYKLTDIIKVCIILIVFFLIYSLFKKSNTNTNTTNTIVKNISTPVISKQNKHIEGFETFGYTNYGNQIILQDYQQKPVYSINTCSFKFNGVYRLEALTLILNNKANTASNNIKPYRENITNIYIKYEDGNGNLKYIKTKDNPESPNTESPKKFVADNTTDTLNISDITDENNAIVYTSKIIVIFGDIQNKIDNYIDTNGIGYISKFDFWGSSRDMMSKFDFELNNLILNTITYASDANNNSTDNPNSNYDNTSNSDKFIFTNTTDHYIYGILLNYNIISEIPATSTRTQSESTTDLYSLTSSPFKLSILYNNSIYSGNNFNMVSYYARNDPYIIPTNSTPGSNNTSQYIIFTKPIIANKLEIKVPRVSINSSNNYKKIHIRTLTCYGTMPTQDNVSDYKRIVNTLLSSSQSQGVDICPSVDELVSKQDQVQKICDNLEYQDKVKSEKIRLEKNKQYLLKLKEQQQQVDQLNQVIQTLETNRLQRDKTADMSRVLQYQNQKGIASSVRDLANQRLESQSNNQLYLDVNINGT